MSKVIVVPLSVYIKNNEQNSIEAFAKLGVSKLSMLWHWLPLPSFLRRFQQVNLPRLMDQYRRGEVDSLAFAKAMQPVYPSLRISMLKFEKAWNAHTEVTSFSKKAFDEIASLQKQGHKVYLFSGTNPMDIRCIQKAYGKPIPGSHFFSYKEKKLGKELVDGLLDKIYKENPKIKPQDIAWFYAPAGVGPYPQWGWLAWFLAPFKKWFHSGAQKYVAGLQKQSQAKRGFTLVASPREGEPGIIKQTTKLWPAPKRRSMADDASAKPVLAHKVTARSHLVDGPQPEKKKSASQTKPTSRKKRIPH
ncbi:MAG: hypothetical protein BGO43_12215 [Gammaproteobacteria bacterium 39-13]|nr:hypothetical protein [Gammaproteobacteria bacterium]OJV86224.1 MAG: hypothetical protein BGO43_12215 [Gammaproteobacteria bacterium 39-13]